jgi:hypothetical protein
MDPVPLEADERAAIADMPDLARPFAAFGAAAGLFAILALGAFRDAARDVSPLAPMIATAAAGAFAGVALRQWKRLHDPRLAREAVILWVSIICAAAGAASGGVVGYVTWGDDGVQKFAFGGAGVALAFVPSVLVVFDAAKRAARGRHGSLVAATDRRTVLSTVLAGIAFAGATQVPAILSVNASSELTPLTQVALSFAACLGATVGIVVLERRDKHARGKLDAFAKDAAWLDPVEEHDAPMPSAAVDLGLGAQQWTRANDAGYRKSGRGEVQVKGDIEEATRAFDECTRRRHRSLVTAASGLTAVAVAFALRLGVLL